MTRLFLALLLTLCAGAAHAQLANQPPVPQWLSVEDAGPGTPAIIQTSFVQDGPLLKAILLIAGETATDVSVNCRPAGTAPAAPGQPATSLDVTSFIQSGSNTLSLTAAAPRLRVAALLELNGDLATKRWITTSPAWTTQAGRLTAGGSVDADAATNPFDLKKTFDAYNSWQLAKKDRQSQATDPSAFTLPAGFKAELIRSARPEDDSWIALAFDPQGCITLAREKRGLLRLDPKDGSLRLIEDSLLECRGLLHAHGVLYANANNSKGLYRLRDLDGDGTYEDKKELMHTEGGVGHGRNHIKLGPDGRIWVSHGNNVLLPSPLADSSPLKNYGSDQVLPNPWDGTMFDGNVELPAGHVLAYDPATEKIDLVAGGLRNPLDIAFNREGELFTFDADMERDVGASWYMPTRVLHVVPGADFGWRRGTGRFPSWYADTLPSVVDIGLSSPTGIFFGYGARFPAKYQEALFILDWSYGRIIAVHLQPEGASYSGSQETFISGRPLNVTDGCMGPDGAMWFTTGGRGTQSGLYRVTYHGPEAATPAVAGPPAPPGGPRSLRHRLEAMHAGVPADQRAAALAVIFQALDDHDRHIRWAARVALEQVPVTDWKQEIVEESRGWRAILGCLALARAGGADRAVHAGILSRMLSLDWAGLDEEQRLAALRTLEVTCARLGDPTAAQAASLMAWLEPLYPAATRPQNHALCRLLIRLRSPRVLPATLPLLEKATASEDLIFYPLHLRYVKEGWTHEARRTVFEALNRAEKLNGASTYFKSIQDTRSELAAALPPDQAAALAAIIHPPRPVALSPHALPGHTFKVWTLADLEGRLDQVGRGRSYEKGRAAAISAQCVFCHTMSQDKTLPAGLFGPELVQVSARFSRRDLLDHILNPSKVLDEKFRFLTLTRTDGTQVTGSLESEDDERIILRPSPLAPDTVEVGKSQVRDRKVSDVSPMPAGLLNALRAEQVLDLLAFIEAGGDPTRPHFQP